LNTKNYAPKGLPLFIYNHQDLFPEAPSTLESIQTTLSRKLKQEYLGDKYANIFRKVIEAKLKKELIGEIENIWKSFLNTNKKSAIRVGVGHIVFSAPLIGLLDFNKNNSEQTTNITSFFNETNEGVQEPCFDLDSSEERFPYTAIELLEHLKSGKLDVIALPHSIYNSIESITREYEYFCHIGSLCEVYSNSGVKVLVSTYNDNTEFNQIAQLNDSSLTDYDIRKYWVEFLKTGKEKSNDFSILYVKHTLSDVVARLISDELEESGLKVQSVRLDSPINKWESFKENFSRNMEKNPSKYYVFLCWEPHISWVEEYLTSKNLKSFMIDRAIFSGEKKSAFSFDLFVNPSHYPNFYKDELFTGFLKKLEISCREIANDKDFASNAELSGNTAKYLNISKQRLKSELNKIHFQLRYSSEFLRHILQKTK
jgi:hypothetical protein